MGEILVSGSYLEISGSLSLSGGINLQYSKMDVEGSLIAGGNIIVGTEDPYSRSSLDLVGTLTTPLLYIEPISSLYINYTNSSIFGNIKNDGVVCIVQDNILFVSGNYSQATSGQIALIGLDPVNNRTSLINVSGHADLAGSIVYSVRNTYIEAERKFIIFYSLKGINGKFTDDLVNGGEGNASAKLDYIDNSIYFLYGFKEHHDDHHDLDKKFLGLEWWTWMLILIGGISFILIVMYCYYCCAVKGKYDPIEDEVKN